MHQEFKGCSKIRLRAANRLPFMCFCSLPQPACIHAWHFSKFHKLLACEREHRMPLMRVTICWSARKSKSGPKCSVKMLCCHCEVRLDSRVPLCRELSVRAAAMCFAICHQHSQSAAFPWPGIINTESQVWVRIPKAGIFVKEGSATRVWHVYDSKRIYWAWSTPA